MKTLIVLLAMAFSANSFAHGFYLSPSQKLTLSPFFGTSFILMSTEMSTDSVQKSLKQVIADAEDYRQSGHTSIALAESINNIQATQDVSEAEAVDMLVEIAESALL